jgi:hypothetical protein
MVSGFYPERVNGITQRFFGSTVFRCAFAALRETSPAKMQIKNRPGDRNGFNEFIRTAIS